jgi:putative FmdB family regulatory protein
MPTYEYECPAGHAFDLIQKMSDKPRAKCPTCGKPATRKISGGAGLVFKGTGFYITDYGKDGKGPRKESDSPTGDKGDKTSGDKAGGEKTSGDKATGDKAAGEKATGEKPAGPVAPAKVEKPSSKKKESGE